MGDKVDSAVPAEDAAKKPADGEATKTDVAEAVDKQAPALPPSEQATEKQDDTKTDVKDAAPSAPDTQTPAAEQSAPKTEDVPSAAPTQETTALPAVDVPAEQPKSEEKSAEKVQDKPSDAEPQTQVSDAPAQSSNVASNAASEVPAAVPGSVSEKPTETEVRDVEPSVADLSAKSDAETSKPEDASVKPVQQEGQALGQEVQKESGESHAAETPAPVKVTETAVENSGKEPAAGMAAAGENSTESVQEPKADDSVTSVRDAEPKPSGAPTEGTVSKDAPAAAAQAQKNEEPVREPQQSTPAPKPNTLPSSKPGDIPTQPPKTSAPPPKPSPAGHVPPFLQNAPSSVKGSSTPWASTGKVETPAPKPVGPVQMVGSHEDSGEQLAEASEEYRKQFSDRKKFFKQQMEQQGTIPIKVAAPPPSFRPQAPVAEPEIPVVLSQPKVPEALKTPLRIEEDTPSPSVLRSTGSQYSPAAMAAAEAATAPPQPSPTPPPPLQKPGQTDLMNGYPQATPLISSLASPADHYAPTPFHTPETTGHHAGAAPMWSPPGANSTPSQSGAQTYSPGVSFATAPSFNPRPVHPPGGFGGSMFDQPSKPVPFGQQKPLASLPPAFAHQQSPVRTPSPTFNLQQQNQPPVQQKPNLAMTHNQFSAPQQASGGGYQYQPLGPSGQNSVPAAGSQARLPDLTELIGMPALGKKKTFVDSSFYAGNELYPTFEEQVKLCHDISTSLTSEDNKQSLGARMFTRRKITSKKWTVEGGGQRGVNGDQWESGDEVDLENEPPKPNAMPPMKYYMSPKGVDDAQSLMLKDPDIKIYDAENFIHTAYDKS